MTTGLRVLTWALWLLPASMAYAAHAADRAATDPGAAGVMSAGFQATAAFVLFVYASVWFVFRPTRFELDDDSLTIVWPMRRRSIARAAVVSARVIEAADFRRDYGFGVRIGAGGLWGGFGLLKTRQETFSMWISRTDAFVIVELRGARPLLVTPEDPARFVRELRKA